MSQYRNNRNHHRVIATTTIVTVFSANYTNNAQGNSATAARAMSIKKMNHIALAKQSQPPKFHESDQMPGLNLANAVRGFRRMELGLVLTPDEHDSLRELRKKIDLTTHFDSYRVGEVNVSTNLDTYPDCTEEYKRTDDIILNKTVDETLAYGKEKEAKFLDEFVGTELHERIFTSNDLVIRKNYERCCYSIGGVLVSCKPDFEVYEKTTGLIVGHIEFKTRTGHPKKYTNTYDIDVIQSSLYGLFSSRVWIIQNYSVDKFIVNELSFGDIQKTIYDIENTIYRFIFDIRNNIPTQHALDRSSSLFTHEKKFRIENDTPNYFSPAKFTDVKVPYFTSRTVHPVWSRNHMFIKNSLNYKYRYGYVV